MTLSITIKNVTPSKTALYITLFKLRVTFFIEMLSLVMLSVIMLSVVMLSVVMLSVVMLSVLC